MAVQLGLCRARSETQNISFLVTRLNYSCGDGIDTTVPVKDVNFMSVKLSGLFQYVWVCLITTIKNICLKEFW